MSDTREASWYEIALTHSQIVKIFVVLLACLAGAFFSGIWIGRDAASTIQDVPVALALPLAAAEESGEGAEVAQLNFFSEEEVVPTRAVQPAPVPAPADPAGDSTLLDDLTAAAASQTGSVAEVAGAGSPDAPVAVTRETAAPAAASSDDLVIQVFSSNDRDQARRVLGRLAQGGHPAFLSPVEVRGRTMYRVRIGPYAERSQAESVAESVRRAFKLDTWITQNSA